MSSILLYLLLLHHINLLLCFADKKKLFYYTSFHEMSTIFRVVSISLQHQIKHYVMKRIQSVATHSL